MRIVATVLADRRASTRMRLARVEFDGHSCRLTAGDQREPTRVVEVAAQPDVTAARRCQAALRRVDRVEIRDCGDEWRCVLAGTAHRLSARWRVPLRIALGFGRLGIPVLLCSEGS